MSLATQIQVPGGQLPAYVKPPKSKTAATAVIIVPSIFGVTDGLLEQMDEIARMDIFAVAVDPFWQVEAGVIPFVEFERAFSRVKKLPIEKSYADFLIAIDWVRNNQYSNGKVIGVGICFGAPFCLLGARDQKLDALISWHGSRMDSYLEGAAKMKVPMEHHIGGADTFVSSAAVAKIEAAFANHQDVDLFIHPKCDHGFCQRLHPTAYNQKAEQQAITGIQRLAAKIS